MKVDLRTPGLAKTDSIVLDRGQYSPEQAGINQREGVLYRTDSAFGC